jgi:CBS domain-containing protein
MLVKDAMSTQVEFIAPMTNIQDCARKMRQTGVGVLPVKENGKLVGIVTDRDICCRAVGDGRNTIIMTAREIMTKDVSSCFDDQDCIEAGRLMKEKHVRRLVVMDHSQKPVGLLSVDDLARYSHDLAGEILESTAAWPH